MWDCSSQKIVYSTLRVNGCLFVVEQIDGICEARSGERDFCKEDFSFDGFTYCAVVGSTETLGMEDLGPE